MAKRKICTVQVVSSNLLTPHMKRIVLSGEDLSEFPADHESGYIKLLFSPEGEPIQSGKELETLAPAKPMMRTYTIRAFNPNANELTIDFALHLDSEGPASKWANGASFGDSIVLAGPGPVKLVNNNADWFFIVGDMTALPAISCNLEQLPSTAQGYVVIEVTSEDDIQSLLCPNGIEITWVIKNNSEQSLIDTVQNMPWLEGNVDVWCACEFTMMRTLRKYFKAERNVDKENIYISSYWKNGHNEEEHKVIKQQDAAS